MTFASHRMRILALAVLLALLLLLLFVRKAGAGWSADPVQVHATTALCPLVSESDDARRGAVVVWQEVTATGGILRAQHLLASGVSFARAARGPRETGVRIVVTR